MTSQLGTDHSRSTRRQKWSHVDDMLKSRTGRRHHSSLPEPMKFSFWRFLGRVYIILKDVLGWSILLFPGVLIINDGPALDTTRILDWSYCTIKRCLCRGYLLPHWLGHTETIIILVLYIWSVLLPSLTLSVKWKCNQRQPRLLTRTECTDSNAYTLSSLF